MSVKTITSRKRPKLSKDTVVALIYDYCIYGVQRGNRHKGCTRSIPPGKGDVVLASSEDVIDRYCIECGHPIISQSEADAVYDIRHKLYDY